MIRELKLKQEDYINEDYINEIKLLIKNLKP